MRNLNTQESQVVAGGGWLEIAVGIVVAAATATYDMGKTLAANDNNDGVTCKGSPMAIE